MKHLFTLTEEKTLINRVSALLTLEAEQLGASKFYYKASAYEALLENFMRDNAQLREQFRQWLEDNSQS